MQVRTGSVLCGAGAVLSVVAAFTPSWWVIGSEQLGGMARFSVGLRTIEMCILGMCQESALPKLGQGGSYGAFRAFGTITFILALVAALLLVGAAVLDISEQGEEYRDWALRGGKVVVPGAALTAILAWMQAPQGLELSWGLPVLVGGAIAGGLGVFSLARLPWEAKQGAGARAAVIGAGMPAAMMAGGPETGMPAMAPAGAAVAAPAVGPSADSLAPAGASAPCRRCGGAVAHVAEFGRDRCTKCGLYQ